MQLFLWFFGLFLIAFCGAYFLTKRQDKRPKLHLCEGGTLRILGLDGPYRSKITALGDDQFECSAPLRQGEYVPLRVGDVVRVEAPIEGGVYKFRTVILNRDADTHTFSLALPVEFIHENRREGDRVYPEKFLPTRVNGDPAVIVDYSERGARLLTVHRLEAGDMIRFGVPHREDEVLGCVLSVTPDALDGRQASCIRVAFH